MLRHGFLLAVWLGVGTAWAQPWTIQTAAYRDFRIAREVIAQLREVGFDAYHEFAMHDGLQYARVRVGCFVDPDSAANVAALLRRVTQDAVVVPMSDDAEARPCVRFDLGFNEPPAWGIHSSHADGVVFWVMLGGYRGYIAYTPGGWQVLQQAPSPAEGSSWLAAAPSTSLGAIERVPAVTGIRYGSSPFAAATLVTANLEDGPLVVGGGELIWSSAHAAIVRTGGTLIAVSLVTKP